MKKQIVFRLSILFFILFGLVTFSEVKAQMPENAVAITPHFGGYIFEGNQDLDNAPIAGIGIEYLFGKRWSVEGVLDYVNTHSDASVDVDGYLTHVDLLYHFLPSKRLVPYLAAGAGLITINPQRGENDTDFMMNYGAGLRYFLTDSLSLRGDVRHILAFDGISNNLAYTIGLTYMFGVAKEVPKDTDGDGVIDKLDKCPDTPRGVTVDQSGCPLDTDGDGVYDYLDKCPGTPKGVSVDSHGCPLDSDHDGVCDYLDQCPNTPVGAKVDKRGCWVLGGVLFDVDKWTIRPQFMSLLDDVVRVLKENPDLRLEIQGHTDNTGSFKYNMKLSKKRAKAVMNYLVERGISPSRLIAKGYGYTMPVASNDTPEGRAKNRRVELKPLY